jgi:tripartite-type tricarboxylate transporter receptor subunit TctC
MNTSYPGFRRRVLLGAASALGLTPWHLGAQDNSNGHALKVLVGYPAGGGGDVLARAVTKRLTQTLNRPVVVDNRPGAGGTLAAQVLAHSPPDGSTVYMTDSATLVAPSLYEKLGYEPQSLSPILGLGRLGYAVVVHPSFPARTLDDLIRVLKAAPGLYSYASPGVGNMAHLAAEKFKQAARLDMVHVPYKGGAPALSDLMGGQIPICFISLPPALAQRASGKLRILAITTAKRWESAADIPTVAETLTGFETVTQMFVLAPPKTPAVWVERLAAGFGAAMEDNEVRKIFADSGASVELSSADALTRQIQTELNLWPDLVRRIGIKPG